MTIRNPRVHLGLTLYFLMSLFPGMACSDASAQVKVVTYEESDEDIVNPERGFYIPTQTKASNFKPLDEEVLRSYRTTEQKVARATYGVRATLIYRAYELDTFRTRPISQEFLERMDDDFDVVRRAGLKVILRFMYTNRSHKGDCPDKSICPPYGDAAKEVVLGHIRQLKPVFQKHADVIAVLQSGFIGIWGENYYTDYFGDASANGAGRLLDSNWTDRSDVLKALLDVLPKSRMVQVRTPQAKQKFVYGPSAPVTSEAMDSTDALNGSDVSRIGFHNDCFLASADDYGTYSDYGSSSQQPGAATDALRKYIEQDTRFTAVGGETCDDAFSPQNDCEPAGYAQLEMRRMHYSYLNASYNNQVNNDWDSAGCMIAIKKDLGYRIVLQKTEAPLKITANKENTIRFSIYNKGYAAPFNPRPMILLLVNKTTGKKVSIPLKADVRTWRSGPHQITEIFKVPKNTPAGSYRVMLALPDPSPTIKDRPEYHLVFANKDIVQRESGVMDLLADVEVVRGNGQW